MPIKLPMNIARYVAQFHQAIMGAHRPLKRPPRAPDGERWLTCKQGVTFPCAGHRIIRSGFFSPGRKANNVIQMLFSQDSRWLRASLASILHLSLAAKCEALHI